MQKVKKLRRYKTVVHIMPHPLLPLVLAKKPSREAGRS
jgi:hypothetical protein